MVKEEEFDGRRYDSSGGYEMSYPMTAQELQEYLVQKAKDDLEKYLQGGSDVDTG